MQGMETKPAPGDAGTDSGTDDDAKQQSAEERGLRNHRKRKAEAHTLKQAAAEGASEAAEAMPPQKQQHRPDPEPAGVSCLPDVRPHEEALSCQVCLMQFLCTWARVSFTDAMAMPAQKRPHWAALGHVIFALNYFLLQRLSPSLPEFLPISHSAVGIEEGGTGESCVPS